MYLFIEPESDDGGSGLHLDKLEGSRRDNLRQRSILEMPMRRSYLPKEKTRTGLEGESLVIKPGFLKQGLTYFLEVKVTDEGQYSCYYYYFYYYYYYYYYYAAKSLKLC